MSETTLGDILILRKFAEPIPKDAFTATADGAGEALQELTAEGVGIRWVESHVRTQAGEAVVGTFCHYQGENEEVIREHAARAGLPVTGIDHHGKPLEANRAPIMEPQHVQRGEGRATQARYAI